MGWLFLPLKCDHSVKRVGLLEEFSGICMRLWFGVWHWVGTRKGRGTGRSTWGQKPIQAKEIIPRKKRHILSWKVSSQQFPEMGRRQVGGQGKESQPWQRKTCVLAHRDARNRGHWRNWGISKSARSWDWHLREITVTLLVRVRPFPNTANCLQWSPRAASSRAHSRQNKWTS